MKPSPFELTAILVYFWMTNRQKSQAHDLLFSRNINTVLTITAMLSGIWRLKLCIVAHRCPFNTFN